jgi:hypothetical protein
VHDQPCALPVHVTVESDMQVVVVEVAVVAQQ